VTIYPISLSNQTVNGLPVGASISNILNGSGKGSFGWLTWNGDTSDPALIASLTVPGNVSTYINPNNTTDHVLNTGDSVLSRPGAPNSSGINAALTSLEGVVITVPVWDTTLGSGANLQYHTVNFAQVEITSFQLSGTNEISATFLGFANCGSISTFTDSVTTGTASLTDTTTWASSNGQVLLSVPAGALPGANAGDIIQIQFIVEPNSIINGANQLVTFELIINDCHADPTCAPQNTTQITTFNPPGITATLIYDPSELATLGLTPENMHIFLQSGTNPVVTTQLDTTVDTADNEVIATIPHLTIVSAASAKSLVAAPAVLQAATPGW